MIRRHAASGCTLTAALLVAALSMAGCATEEEQWCSRVADASEGLGRTVDEGGPTTGLLDALPTLQELADEAPSDVRGEWRTLVAAVADLDAAVHGAGLEPAEITGELPADLPASDRKAIEAASLKLVSPEVRAAADTVEQQARDVCRTALF